MAFFVFQMRETLERCQLESDALRSQFQEIKDKEEAERRHIQMMLQRKVAELENMEKKLTGAEAEKNRLLKM